MNQLSSLQYFVRLWIISFLASVATLFGFSILRYQGLGQALAIFSSRNFASSSLQTGWNSQKVSQLLKQVNGRPQLTPLPEADEIWECEVAVIGGSLGGIAAASHAMLTGAQTCLIELTPWLGGQISSQGVSALDESMSMRSLQNFSPSWQTFKQRLENSPALLPSWSNLPSYLRVVDLNSCWVGFLCFSPKAGAAVAEQLLKDSVTVPGTRWSTSTAFKGAEFDISGQEITAIYAVRRIPRDRNYIPTGRFSKEIASWYSWSADAEFEKVSLRLEAPAGKRMIVIDATDTGELVAWANMPYRVGSDAKTVHGEWNAPKRENPECTQAFTFPFTLALRDDQGAGLQALADVKPIYNLHEHIREFSLDNHTMFEGKSLFHYRRIISTTLNHPQYGVPALGDITMVNWTKGNDWNWMDPPLILTPEKLAETGQYQNWMGGISPLSLEHAENHALLFSRWLIENQSTPNYPLAHLAGADGPMGTVSGLSMVPYIREGRRILGRPAYGQTAFQIREPDVRADMSGGRNFSATAVGFTHYDVDIHGCRYRNWNPTGEAQGAGTLEYKVRPLQIPLEALIPQGVNNVLIGGKGMAVSHIANAMTRVHYGEWTVGAASGAIAGWLVTQGYSDLMPPDITALGLMPQLQDYLREQGLRLSW